jgi:hypothetical protein
MSRSTNSKFVPQRNFAAKDYRASSGFLLRIVLDLTSVSSLAGRSVPGIDNWEMSAHLTNSIILRVRALKIEVSTNNSPFIRPLLEP